MKTKGLDKFLSSHKPSCTIHIFSDGDDRHCSCGRDRGVVEKDVLVEGFEWLIKAYEYLLDHDSISANSVAFKELEEIVRKASYERIVSPK